MRVGECEVETLQTANDPRRLFRRSSGPLLTPDMIPYPANTVFNPGAASLNPSDPTDPSTVLLVRVEDLEGLSELTVARSADGKMGWSIESRPLLVPGIVGEASRWGVEDARVTWVAELGAWVIAFTAFGPGGPRVALALTRDWQTIEDAWTVTLPEDKNASLLPRRVGEQWILFHRPATAGGKRDVWLSTSADLKSWETYSRPVLVTREEAYWDSLRMGMGPPPVETEAGWLCMYHGVKGMSSGAIYRAGLVLLDLDDPRHVLRRTKKWVLGPLRGYETAGDVGNVVFPTGLVVTGDEARVYYGGGDGVVGLATASVSELLTYLLALEPEPELLVPEDLLSA